MIMSGLALMTNDSDSSEGPVSAGAGVFVIVHDSMASAATANIKSFVDLNVCISSLLRIGKIREIHADISRRLDIITAEVLSVKCHFGNCRDNLSAAATRKRAERRFLLRVVANELERH